MTIVTNENRVISVTGEPVPRKLKHKQCPDTANEPLPDQFTKHPLKHSWTLWYFEHQRSDSWLENQRKVTSFATIEDFWSLYNHVEPASKLMPSNDYSVFKSNIKPMWEDPANRQGGRWVLTLDKRMRHQVLDDCWREILMAMIGESFGDHGDIVNGAVVNVRNGRDRVSVWLATAHNETSILTIGNALKAKLGLGNSVPLFFETHQDSQKKTGSTAKSRYTI